MSRLRLGALLLVWLWLAIITLPVGSQERVDLRGVILGRDGAPQIRASIQLNGPARYVAITNAQGEFFLRNVVTGDYVITVFQEDKMQRFSVRVAGETLSLKVPW